MNIKFRASLKPQHKLWIVIRFMSSAIWNHWLWMGFEFFFFASFTRFSSVYVASNSLLIRNTRTTMCNVQCVCVCMYAVVKSQLTLITLLNSNDRLAWQQTTMNRFYFVNTNTIWQFTCPEPMPMRSNFFLSKTQQNKHEYMIVWIVFGVCIYIFSTCDTMPFYYYLNNIVGENVNKWQLERKRLLP